MRQNLKNIYLYSPFFIGLVFPLLNEMQKPHTHMSINNSMFNLTTNNSMFHLTPTHTVFNLYSSHTVFNCTTTNSILRFSKNSRRYTSQDSSFLRTSQYSHYWENMRQRRSFSFPSSHYCTNFSLYLKKSLFHAGAFVSDGILAASSRVALAKVDLRSRELINRSVLPHKHLDGLRSVLFVHPMPDFATSTLSLSNVAVTAPYWLLFRL